MWLKLNRNYLSECGYVTKRALNEGLSGAIYGYVQDLQVSEEGNKCVIIALVRHYTISNSWFRTRVTIEGHRVDSWSCACIRGYVDLLHHDVLLIHSHSF